ncbi:MAG: YicC/YloC family endoribonuclease [Parachlamydiaceae bacterium]
MFKSMTAYGRASILSPLGRFSVELQSVNRKHLEINSFGIPKEFIRYDVDIKKWIAAVVARGQINVRISAIFEGESPLMIAPNLPLARQTRDAWLQIADHLDIKIDDKALLTILSRTEGVLSYDEDIEELEKFKQVLHDVVEKTLRELVSMKIAEGKILHEDISARFGLLGTLIEDIAVKAPSATDRYRQKLQERLQEVLGNSLENEERLLREVCIYADRIDITEELTRFRSHLQQVKGLLESEGQEVGKKMEFFVQELNREVNTIGSKSSDTDVSRAVIAIKTELERIREQIQNIE